MYVDFYTSKKEERSVRKPKSIRFVEIESQENAHVFLEVKIN